MKKKKKKVCPKEVYIKCMQHWVKATKNLEYHVILTCKGAVHCFISN